MKPKHGANLGSAIVQIKSDGKKVILVTEEAKLYRLSFPDLKQDGVFDIKQSDFFRYSNNLSISPDCRLLAYAAKDEGGYFVAETSSLKVLYRIEELHSKEVYSLVFDASSKMVLSGGTDGRSFVFDTATKRSYGSFGVCGEFVSALAFSPDSKNIALASYNGKIRLYEIKNNENFLLMLGFEEPIIGLKFLNEHELLSLYRNGEMLIFDTRTLKIKTSPKKLNDGASFFESSKLGFLTSGRDRCIRLYKKRDFELLSECFIKADSIISSAVMPDDNSILIGCLDGGVYSFELDGDLKELDTLVLNGEFGKAYELVQNNPFLKGEEDYKILEEAWNMNLGEIIDFLEDGKKEEAKRMSQDYMQVAEKRGVLQRVFKQFEEFDRLKYAALHQNKELFKSLLQKNEFFKFTKVYHKNKALSE